jgi:hypothetical protein
MQKIRKSKAKLTIKNSKKRRLNSNSKILTQNKFKNSRNNWKLSHKKRKRKSRPKSNKKRRKRKCSRSLELKFTKKIKKLFKLSKGLMNKFFCCLTQTR